MKKRYEKPQIVFESFEMSTNIAGDCEIKTNTPSAENCAYEVYDEFLGTVFLFVTGVSACTTKEATGAYDKICYHVPYGENLFNS